MASSSFRDSMNSLGWSRRETTATTANQQTSLLGSLQKYNPFGNEGSLRLPVHNNEGPGAPLPAPSRREEEEGWFALSRWDRLLLFGGLNLAAVALFIICFTLLPFLPVKPTKFAILWSTASVLFLASWAVMMGPMVYGSRNLFSITSLTISCAIARHLISDERLPFTATYFGSIALTLYFAVGLHSIVLTILTSIVQLVALVWYLVSYFPMGSQGLRFAARFGTGRVMAWMNG